ncbi:MAG: CRISPR-associated protein Cas4 [Anaerolineae bacterium]
MERELWEAWEEDARRGLAWIEDDIVSPDWGEGRWYLRVTDLKQYAYCPRVIYFTYCLPTLRPTTFKMEAGRDAHEQAVAQEQRRRLAAYGLKDGERHFGVRLVSDRLGLSGLVDLVLVRRDPPQAWPVDYKQSRRPTAHHHKLQLTAYGLLLEEVWGIPAPEGYIYSLVQRKAERVPLTRALRTEVLALVREMHEMLREERMPPPPNARRRCLECEFRRFCNDV